MTPGERTQKGPHSGRGHHRMGQHPISGTRPEPTHMINMGGAHQHRSYQRAHLTTPVRATHPATPTAPSDPPHLPTPNDPSASRPPTTQRRPPTPHHRKPPHTGRYSAILHSQEVPPDSGPIHLFRMAIVPDQRHFPRLSTPNHRISTGGFRLRGCADRYSPGESPSTTVDEYTAMTRGSSSWIRLGSIDRGRLRSAYPRTLLAKNRAPSV